MTLKIIPDESVAMIGRLESRLGYTFQNPDILGQALTHRSYANEQGIRSGNKTLAFLGDAVLQFFVTTRLYKEMPEETVGVLTERRKAFVCQSVLSEKAKTLSLGEVILFGKGEKQQGGALKDNSLSEALEAVIGGIYLDGGLNEAFQFLSRQFEI